MDMFSVFQPGIMISTKHGTDGNWILNSITDVDQENNLIEVLLNKEYLVSTVLKGDSIDIKVSFSDALYIAQGSVEDVVIEFPQRISLHVKSVRKIENRREETRFDANLSSLIKGTEVESADFSIITNISKSGIGIVSKDNFPIGVNIFIDIFIDENTILKLKGVSVRKKARGNNIEYGVVTTPVDDYNERILNKLLGDLEEKERLMVSVIKKIRQSFE